MVLRTSRFVGSSEVLPIQVGISISKKVSKRAVVRNRIKRQLKAIVRQLLPRLESGLRMVILVRSEALTYEYGEFLQELEQLLVNAEVLHGD